MSSGFESLEGCGKEGFWFLFAFRAAKLESRRGKGWQRLCGGVLFSVLGKR